MITYLCYRCKTNTEPFEGGVGGFWCDTCRQRLSHFIRWKSPEEDAAAKQLIERELNRKTDQSEN